ncbi:MAG: GntR family transcriptional regulator [Planctomycetes bacterium]|nr:GntR family transcriptional regulator [Planctomycetota bacterium]
MTSKSDNLIRSKGKRTFLYRQLSKILREKITGGEFAPGDRIPSMDDMASEYKLNKATVRSAIAELIAEGIIYSVPAQGTFVSERSETPATPIRRGMTTIGVISTVMVPNDTGPLHIKLLDAMRVALAPINANLMLLHCNHEGREQQVMDVINTAGIDGLICVGPFSSNALRLIAESDYPAVVVGHTQPGIKLDMVCADNRGGAFLAIEHLLDLGHRKIGIIAGERSQPDTAERMEGAKDAFRAEGIIMNAPIAYGDFQAPGGFEAMKSLLENHADLSAVFCMNDEMAAGAIQAICENSNKNIPNDISVVGFDDIYLASQISPRLTTVNVPVEEMAKTAVQKLTKRMSGDEEVPTSVTLATSIVVRDSTKAV